MTLKHRMTPVFQGFSDSCIDGNKASSIISFTDKVQTVCNDSPHHDIAFVWHARLGHRSPFT